MTTSKLIFLLLLTFATLGMQAQRGITVEANTKANKTSFFQGEVVVLDIIITNNSNENVKLCYCSGWKLYSKTYQKEGQDLKDIAPGVNPPKAGRSHPFVTPPTSSTPVRCTCGDFPALGDIIIPSGSSIHHPMPVNTCDPYIGCYPGGRWPANLPVGEYEFTYYLSFSNAPSVEKKIAFSMVEPTRSQRLYLEKLAATYDVSSIDSWLQLMEAIQEPAIVDKILNRVVTNGNMGAYADFWADHVARYSNEALLIHQLSAVAMMDDNDKRRNRTDFYQRIVNNLRDKDERITEAFMNQIESANLSKANRAHYEKIPSDKIGKLKMDWKNSKHKIKDK